MPPTSVETPRRMSDEILAEPTRLMMLRSGHSLVATAGLHVSRMSTQETIPRPTVGSASVYAHLPADGRLEGGGTPARAPERNHSPSNIGKPGRCRPGSRAGAVTGSAPNLQPRPLERGADRSARRQACREGLGLAGSRAWRSRRTREADERNPPHRALKEQEDGWMRFLTGTAQTFQPRLDGTCVTSAIPITSSARRPPPGARPSRPRGR